MLLSASASKRSVGCECVCVSVLAADGVSASSSVERGVHVERGRRRTEGQQMSSSSSDSTSTNSGADCRISGSEPSVLPSSVLPPSRLVFKTLSGDDKRPRLHIDSGGRRRLRARTDKCTSCCTQPAPK
eukprot:3837921-Prymnesium_polylepis.3